jgi:adenosine deaminase
MRQFAARPLTFRTPLTLLALVLAVTQHAHAGELAPGLVPPAGLRFHIREAIELGHAERIGHGVQYVAAGVPVALATDDEGVSRIDRTHEYVRAVSDLGLSYAELKRSARASLEHSFLPGGSLWLKPDAFTSRVRACNTQAPGSAGVVPACAAYLSANPKAEAQWDLESRFRSFETHVN